MSRIQNINLKISLKAGLKKLLVIFFIIIGFFLLAAFLIALLRLSQKGFSLKVFHEALQFAQKVVLNPFYLFEVYLDWGKIFWKAWQTHKLTDALYIPLFLPLLLFSFLLWKSRGFCKKFTENLKSVVFSHPQKLVTLGLMHGKYTVLGVYDDMLLQMTENKSLLVLGDSQGGKTSSVCVPTILSAHESCIVAVSSQNELAEFTSGYRASLGNVFYLNWGLSDSPLKNEYYPRWNPLSVKELPAKGEKRDAYLKWLSQYFILHNVETESMDDDYWPKLAGRALFGLLSFFVAKIERAAANDYFLGTLLEKGRLTPEDKRLLLSYYVIMNQEYAAPAIENLEHGNLNKENYLPIGSWEGVPQAWQGKELCFSMFADWLLQSFLLVKAQEKASLDAWKIVLEYCLQEAEFFGYVSSALEILQQLFYLSRKQRSVIFPMLFNPLSVFRNSAVRERTSTSDFTLSQLRTTYDDKVNTIYCVSGDKNVNFLNKLFVDMLLKQTMSQPVRENERPLLWVFDNIERQPEYKNLAKALSLAEKWQMAFVITAASLANLQIKYSSSDLENIINQTQYKILLSENIQNAVGELQKLSNGGIVISAAKNSLPPLKINEAVYYRKVAKYLEKMKKTVLEQGDEILLVPSFYRMPFKIRSAYFLDFENMKKKATIDAAYFVSDEMLHGRNIQDMETPDLLDVLQNAGCKLNNLAEIDIYLEDKYEEAVETIEQVADKESVLVDDISARWQNRNETSEKSTKDWWMSEDAFDFSDVKENSNPFRKK